MASSHIYDTPTGRRAVIRIHGQLYQKRFPRGTPDLILRQWLLQIEVQARRAPARSSGVFAEDAAAYLAAVRAMPTYVQRKQHIDEWIAAFGPVRRATITPQHITAILHRWRSEPRTIEGRRWGRTPRVLSAAAVNKRRTALQHLWTVLDGKAAYNPVRETPKFAEPAPAPRAIPYEEVRRLLALMPDSKSKARLMVLAYTGIPPAQIGAITEADVNWTAHTVAVEGRKKGAGTPARVVPLTPDGIAAFTLMRSLDAFGPFTSAPLGRAFKHALRRAGLPTSYVAYDLRHSFGTEVYRRSGDIRATQLLLGHSTERLTHRYTVAAQDTRVAAAIALFGPRPTKRRARP